MNGNGAASRMDEPRIDELIARQRPGFTLEQPFYRDREIFRRDMARVVGRAWLYVAHACELPRPGDYLLYEIGEESIVVLRGRDGEVRAFFNVCRHRGSHICLEPRGHVRTLTCPYHAWVYDLQGRLIGARSMPRGFDKSAFGLHPCRVETVHGLIFVCLAAAGDPQVADFAAIAADLDRFAARHRLAETRIVHRKVYPTHANWKLVVDNFRECYHCSPAHPEYTMVNAYVGAQDRDPEGYRAPTRAWEEKTAALGHPVGQSEGDGGDPRQPHGYWRQPIREGFVTLSEDGRAVAPLLGCLEHWDGGETAFSFGPLSYAYLCADHLAMFRFTPTGPQFTEVAVTWHVRADAREGADYDLERLIWMWDVTTVEDTRIIIDNQKGVNSARYLPGPYAPQEAYSADFTRWYLQRLAG